MNKKEIPSGVYRHYKGKEYDIYGVVILAGTEDATEPVYQVIYRPKYGAKLATSRELNEFLGMVSINGTSCSRFLFVREFNDDEADAKILAHLLSV